MVARTERRNSRVQGILVPELNPTYHIETAKSFDSETKEENIQYSRTTEIHLYLIIDYRKDKISLRLSLI